MGHCNCCAPASEHVIADARGKPWRFEQHRMFGPLVLRADGEPAARQPGSRSPFWPAWERWRDQHQPRRDSGTTDQPSPHGTCGPRSG